MSTTADTERVNLRQALIITDFYKLTKHSQAEDIAECFEQLKPYVKDATPSERAQLKKIVLDHCTEAKIKSVREIMSTILFPPPKASETGNEQPFIDDPPAEEEQDGAVLFRELVDLIQRHVILEREQAIVVALWIAHTYLIDVWGISPLLLLTSATHRCGKSTLLTMIGALVLRAVFSGSITPAAVFRLIEAYQPTLVIDEADTFFKDNEELRGVINCGHTRYGAYVWRCEGENNDPRRFSTWAAKAIAMIKKPDVTIIDRSLVIELRRKRASETVAPISLDTVMNDFGAYRRRLRRWADDYRDELAAAKPELPSELNDRAKDNAKPLLAIAETVSVAHAKSARLALVQVGGTVEDDEAGTVLLSDVKVWFEEHEDRDTVPSKELVEYLVELEGRPWPEWRRGDPLKANGLARLLKPFGITPANIWITGTCKKGYAKHQFEEAWERYEHFPAAQDPPHQPLDRKGANETGAKSRKSNRYGEDMPSGSKNEKNPDKTELYSGLAVENPGSGGGEKKTEAESDPEKVVL